MKKRYKSGLLISALATAALMVGSSALAAHPDFAPGVSTLVLKDASGADIVLATTPYSPKETCATAGCHDYGSGHKQAHKTQGVIESDDTIYWQSYTVEAFAHGAVVGRHSQQGRNEDYGNHMRNVYGDPFFTSSPGMFGKF